MGAFFYPGWVLALDCPTSQFDETARVKSVHDGDTLKLTDGRKIRLIGINTPELARDGKSAQAFALEARDFLKQLIQSAKNNIQLVYGIERKDKYKRTLAHLYLPDGNNIQALLIREGLATAFTTPPNDRLSSCYRALENTAIQQKKGIWSLADYQPIATTALTRNHRGFRRITGLVVSTHKSDNSFWIKLEGSLAIRIKQHNLKYFKLEKLNELKGKTIITRGWIHPEKSGHFMNLSHPDAFSLIPPTVH